LFFSKKEHEFSNRQRKIPTIEGDRQEAQTTVFSKISKKSTENRKQEHEDLIIVLNIQRTKGSPPPLPPPQYQKPNQGQMEMGMGGAVNGITNSILTNNDNLSICGLSFMKRTSQYASVLLVNHPANDRSTQKEFCITQYHMV